MSQLQNNQAGASSTEDWRAIAGLFNEVPEIYDTYRPGYPPELIERVIVLASLPPEGRILEIGCGPGKATLPFAQRGYSILAIEPGARLVARARENLAAYPRVRFEVSTFEAWPETESGFHLVMAASAFQWVQREVSLAKAARLLRASGSLALFWNMQPGLEETLARELDQVYQDRAPELRREVNPSCEQMIQERESEVLESGLFGPVTVWRFPWQARYDVPHYLGLLSTYSPYIGLSPERRASLFAGLAEFIAGRGGWIDKPFLSVLYVAPKRGQ